VSAADPAPPLAEQLRRIAVELAALAQTGSAFAQSRYDTERYARLSDLSAELMGLLTDVAVGDISSILAADGGYATPHVDVRGALFDGDRVLLVREAADALWTLPGGWADVLDTPTSAVEREFAEEAGLPVRATRVAAVYDGNVSNGHLVAGPPFHIWKVFFLCERRDDADPRAGLDGETTEVGFFALDALPPLSTRRATEAQLRRLAEYHRDPALPAEAD
jgi:ADP-ribose pyrophosphatase YjhB (NUDIX family)